LMQGPWELDLDGKNPALYIDAPDGGDPLIVASIKRIYRPDVLQAMGLPHKLPPPPDELARLRAEVERLTAALSDERAHADAMAEAVKGAAACLDMLPATAIACGADKAAIRAAKGAEDYAEVMADIDSALAQHRARRQG
ncbi:hypothetical protein O4J55_25490, partial [Paracoccus sp. PXZ]